MRVQTQRLRLRSLSFRPLHRNSFATLLGVAACLASVGSPAAPAAAADGRTEVGRHCDWDTTITGRPSTMIDEAWVDEVVANREDVLTGGQWKADLLHGLLDQNFVVPDPGDFHPRPIDDLGDMTAGHEAGWRVHPVLGHRTFHSGFDFGGAVGDPLWSLTTGTVVQADYRSAYGNRLVIDHGQGFVTIYAHLSRFMVSVGDSVDAGQVVGTVGSTGRATGPHLHFETRLGGVPVNPRFFVNDLAGPGEAGVVYDELATIPNDAAASIYRLYSAYFLRCPDPRGFAYWVNHGAAGHDLASVSNAFAGSEEFRLTYGDSLPDDEFLELVYRHVLGREVEGGGKSYWLGQLSSGMTRGDVMLAFSDSAEYRSLAGF